MNSALFTAFVVANEINLNILAEHFGFNKKYRWEDPLVLKETNLSGILTTVENKFVYVYYFGTVVFINFTHHEAMDVLNYLARLEKNISTGHSFAFQDDFKLVIDTASEPSVNYEDMTTDEFAFYHLEIISTILAKSVALEKIEREIDKLFDDIENIVDLLEKGRFNISDRRLAKISAKILGYKFNSISYIMLLDKPDITWVNENAGNLYTELSQLFELDERFTVIQQKSETLMDITQAFTGLTHATRGTRLEWMIIILIAFEILLSLLEKII
ncbi:MAG: RMD1 family protein [Peptococcaceae bacterium]